MGTKDYWDRWAAKGKKKVLPGTRVRIRGRPIAVDFVVNTGTVLGADIWDGYYAIRLDRPAKYHNADGTVEDLLEIREAWENLELLEPAGSPDSPNAAGRPE